eukprot:TRINITY_DN3114_c2_g1_i1.p1 TRINITY_DN3114_c2_g1~~TRINITY_DN3114_c2_g1_i1.p1  ORF type:complete len:579 (-),score=221.42 TRINITY_DN3114_c2_g1_i1:255-1991(-)
MSSDLIAFLERETQGTSTETYEIEDNDCLELEQELTAGFGEMKAQLIELEMVKKHQEEMMVFLKAALEKSKRSLEDQRNESKEEMRQLRDELEAKHQTLIDEKNAKIENIENKRQETKIKANEIVIKAQERENDHRVMIQKLKAEAQNQFTQLQRKLKAEHTKEIKDLKEKINNQALVRVRKEVEPTIQEMFDKHRIELKQQRDSFEEALRESERQRRKDLQEAHDQNEDKIQVEIKRALLSREQEVAQRVEDAQNDADQKILAVRRRLDDDLENERALARSERAKLIEAHGLELKREREAFTERENELNRKFDERYASLEDTLKRENVQISEKHKSLQERWKERMKERFEQELQAQLNIQSQQLAQQHSQQLQLAADKMVKENLAMKREWEDSLDVQMKEARLSWERSLEGERAALAGLKTENDTLREVNKTVREEKRRLEALLAANKSSLETEAMKNEELKRQVDKQQHMIIDQNKVKSRITADKEDCIQKLEREITRLRLEHRDSKSNGDVRVSQLEEKHQNEMEQLNIRIQRAIQDKNKQIKELKSALSTKDIELRQKDALNLKQKRLLEEITR